MLLLLALLSALPESVRAETVAPNDNRTPAGILAGGVLSISLEARAGIWYPEGLNGRGLDAAAWAEPGKPLSTPGPLIRATVGTTIRVHLRNTLTRRLTVFGFGKVRGLADSLVLEPGARVDAEFVAGAPGTYYYTARSTPNQLGGRQPRDTQLHGAIVIDAPDRPRSERIFVISWWFVLDSTSASGLQRGTMALNGLSWPHTERIDMVQGDSARWRVINLTEAPHPMHLHGFYFSVRSKGNGVQDTLYGGDQERLAVTEVLQPFQTLSLAWSPERPGNWIYHCHFIGHVSHLASLDTENGKLDENALSHHGSDRPHQMYGLVLGIRVAPKGENARSTAEARPIRLIVREKPEVYGKYTGYAYVLGGSPAESATGQLPPPPGPMLVLTRDQPVAITIVNQARDRAAVHWHGIELESYPDGVPDWSGWDKEILPSVKPGDSITVRFTPPRAGTFMYHSHFNEEQQISSGLYAPIVVLEPGQQYDPATDRIMMFSSSGPWANVISGPVTPILLNGRATPEPMEFRVGVKYRLRLINMTGDVDTQVALLQDGTPHLWRLVAKDGATVPAVQATYRPARLTFDPGEIYDFEFTPAAAGDLVLNFGAPDAPPAFGWPKRVDVVVRVR